MKPKSMVVPAAIDDMGLSAAAFRIYAHLCRRANGDGVCWPSAPTIARICRLHRDTVWRGVRELEERKLIGREKGVRNGNRYVVLPIEAVGGIEGPTQISESAEKDGRLSAELRGRDPAENEGLVSAEKKGRKGDPRRESIEGNSIEGEVRLSTLPSNLSELEVESLSAAFGITPLLSRQAYEFFRETKILFRRDWDHLRRIDLPSALTSFLRTDRRGQAWLRDHRPEIKRAADYSRI